MDAGNSSWEPVMSQGNALGQYRPVGYLALAVLAGAMVYGLAERPAPIERLLQVADRPGGIERLDPDVATPFELAALAEPGQIVIIEFGTRNCAACARLHRHYQRFLPLRPDVVVKQVQMPTDWTPQWARRRWHLDISSTPHIVLFDAAGQLVAADAGRQKDGFEMLYEWMNRELEQQWALKQGRG
jgi:hypothetical protein